MRQRRLLLLFGVSLMLAGCSTGRGASTSTTGPRATSSTPAASPTTTPPSLPTPYLALWPFTTPGDVRSWQQTSSSDRSDAWHLNASTTALRFARDYLGFSEINAVIGTATTGSGAHVSVGFRPTTATSVTAAVVHLVHWGSGPNPPWEVVGSDDTTFGLTNPTYGATASSPLMVGGTITGADESISVAVHQPSSSSAIGSYCCTPAGGTGSPWAATISYSGATDPVLTVVAATGGHVQAIERFTVTGVRAAGSTGLTVGVVANPSHATVGQVVTFTISIKGSGLLSVEGITFGDGATTGANAGVVRCQVTETNVTRQVTHQYSAPGTYQFTDEVGAIGPPPTCASIDVSGRATVVVGPGR